MQEQIIFEDNHLLIINKKAGQLVQGDKTGDLSLLDLLKNFIKIREQLEQLLIEHKDLIAGILQRSLSNKRNNTYKEILSETIKKLLLNKNVVVF